MATKRSQPSLKYSQGPLENVRDDKILALTINPALINTKNRKEYDINLERQTSAENIIYTDEYENSTVKKTNTMNSSYVRQRVDID